MSRTTGLRRLSPSLSDRFGTTWAQTQSTTPDDRCRHQAQLRGHRGRRHFRAVGQLCGTARQPARPGNELLLFDAQEDGDHGPGVRWRATGAGGQRQSDRDRRIRQRTQIGRRADQGQWLHQFPETGGAVELHLWLGDLPLHHLQRGHPGEHARLQQALADRIPAALRQDPHRLGPVGATLQQTSADADAALQAFIPALFH